MDIVYVQIYQFKHYGESIPMFYFQNSKPSVYLSKTTISTPYHLQI
jgi:hypothetical protein